MKHQIVLIAHEMIGALAYTLQEIEACEDVEVFLYIDARADLQAFDWTVDLASCYWVNDPIEVNFGQASHIHAMLQSLRCVQAHGDYDYVSIMSGNDIFHRTLARFNHFLTQQDQAEFLGATLPTSLKPEQERQVCFKHPEWLYGSNKGWLRKVLKQWHQSLIRRGWFANPIPKPFTQMYAGCPWFTMSQECMAYTLDYVEQNPEYLTFFAQSLDGADLFFHTILMNSALFPNKDQPVLTNAGALEVSHEMALRRIEINNRFQELTYDTASMLNLAEWRKTREENTFILRHVAKDIPAKNLARLVKLMNL